MPARFGRSKILRMGSVKEYTVLSRTVLKSTSKLMFGLKST